MSGMITDNRENLGHVGKIETLSIFPIRPRPSQIIGDVCDLWFSLVCKSGMVGELRNPRSSGISRHMKTRFGLTEQFSRTPYTGFSAFSYLKALDLYVHRHLR